MPTIPIRLRDREILDAQLDQCRQVDNSFTQGAAAGLHWLTAGGPGPLTGTLATSIDFRSILRELAVAEDIIFGSPSPARDYARGLEHALLWADNATAGPPVHDARVAMKASHISTMRREKPGQRPAPRRPPLGCG